MATANDFITNAGEHIGIKQSETPMEAADIQYGLKKLNNLLASWKANGRGVGAAPVKNEADVVRCPDYAIEFIETQLAFRMAPRFGRPLTQVFLQLKADAENEFNKASINLSVELPDTLPLGSGNQNLDKMEDDRFFNQNSENNF